MSSETNLLLISSAVLGVWFCDSGVPGGVTGVIGLGWLFRLHFRTINSW